MSFLCGIIFVWEPKFGCCPCRRSVRYKHQYSSITSEDDQNVEPSQVTFESGNISPSIMGTEKCPSPPIIGSEKRTGEHVPFEEEEEEEELVSK